MVDLQNPKAPIPSLLKSKAIGTLMCDPTAHPWDQLFLPAAVRELRTPQLSFSGGFPLRSSLRASLPDPAHSTHPVVGDSIPIEKVTLVFLLRDMQVRRTKLTRQYYLGE